MTLKLRIILVLFLMNFSTPLFSNVIPLQDIRKWYIEALQSEKNADVALEKIDNIILTNQNNAQLIGYKGAIMGIKAKHAFNPVSKIGYLNQSKDYLSSAIKLDPKNAEIRFLRFSMEHYIPSWLGYSTHLSEDKKVIIANLTKADEKVKLVISKFLKECGRCTQEEVNFVSSLVTNKNN